MRRLRLAALLAAGALAGCASSLSGIGGTERYGCPAPAGAQCIPVSGVYAHPVSPAARTPSAGPRPLPDAPSRSIPGEEISAGLRTAPRVLRLWIAPWEDRDGDLHGAGIVHLVLDPGRWVEDAVRPAARDPFAPVVPPPGSPPQEARATPAADAARAEGR